MPYSPQLINYPTLEAECHDTEARSLKKLNDLMYQINASMAALAKPGAGQVALTTYVYGIQYTMPAGVDLLDISAYNPNDVDCWVQVIMSPGPPAPGMQPQFSFRDYGHNNAYYEAMTSAASAGGQTFSIVVSSAEATYAPNPNPIFLAIRHS